MPDLELGRAHAERLTSIQRDLGTARSKGAHLPADTPQQTRDVFARRLARMAEAEAAILADEDYAAYLADEERKVKAAEAARAAFEKTELARLTTALEAAKADAALATTEAEAAKAAAGTAKAEAEAVIASRTVLQERLDQLERDAETEGKA